MVESQSAVAIGASAVALAAYSVYGWFQPKPFIPKLKFASHLHEFIFGVGQHFNSIEGMELVMYDNVDEDGMSQFYVIGVPCISVLKAEHIRAVVLASNYRTRTPFFDDIVEAVVGKKSLVQIQGAEWKMHRKLIARAFAWQNLVHMAPSMGKIAEEFADHLLSLKEPSVDVFPLVKLATLDVIGETAFGKSFGSIKNADNRVANAFTFLMDDINRRLDNPINPPNIMYSIPTAANKMHHKQVTFLRQTIDNLVEERMKLGADAGNCRDLLQCMINAAAEGDEGGITKESFGDNLLTFLFAGYDTTSIGLAYALDCIARHPEVQDKIVEELDTVVGDSLPTYETSQQLTYCTAVFQESLRLFPPILASMRTLEEDLEINNHLIPKGTSVTLPIYWIHRYAANWGDDAQVFRPERHLESDAHIPAKERGFRFMAFSAGPRNCVGMRFAMLEAVILLAVMVRKCKFSVPPDAPKVRPVLSGLVQKPEHGIWLQIEPRLK